MANKLIKVNEGWQDVEAALSVVLVSGTTYIIGADEVVRVYAKATKPNNDEGYLVTDHNFAYTHESGKKLWVKALKDTNITI